MYFNSIVETKHIRLNVGMESFNSEHYSIVCDNHKELQEIFNQTTTYLKGLLKAWEKERFDNNEKI